MLWGASSGRKLCLSSFSVPGRFQIWQNSSSLSSAEITLMRKLVLVNKEWLLSNHGIFYYKTIFFLSRWLELFLSCNSDSWCHVHSSFAIVPKAQNIIFSFHFKLYLMVLFFCFFFLLNLDGAKCYLKDMGQANSKATFFSTSIVVWQIIQRIGWLGNVSHSALTQRKECKATVVFTVHCFTVGFITSKKGIRKLNTLDVYRFHNGNFYIYIYVYILQTQCEKLHGYKPIGVDMFSGTGWTVLIFYLHKPVCVSLSACVCVCDKLLALLQRRHTHVHLISVWDCPRSPNLWRNTCSHPNSDVHVLPC